MMVEMTHNTAIFSRNRTAAEIWNQLISDSRQAKDKSSTYVSNITEAKLDGRKSKIGCYIRQNHSSWK